MNQPEEWRTLEWAPNYEFSSHGQVRRTKDAPGTFAGKILRQSMANGYKQLNLRVGGKFTSKKVHRVVCEAFHGPPPSVLHQVAHYDGDRTNNRAENLRWAMPKENASDDLRNGNRPAGEKHPLARLKEGDIIAIRNEHREFIDALASFYDVQRGTILSIISNRTWRLIGAGHSQPPA
jgi:hypothetical protein